MMLLRVLSFLKGMRMPVTQAPVATVKPAKPIPSVKSKTRRDIADSDGKIRRQKHMVECNRLI
ncbi:hypothetical protein [uncultured Phyllobacterium sp.]|uniref:hypothetical protein n=1 Tax=uncultured Phyllobacterium sp. TaxID=253813 RepID=UPI00258F02FE|nr:hypothetical protein [uncultured Phyllobacterium sp.]